MIQNQGTKIAAQDLAADMPLIVGTMVHAMVLTRLTYNRTSTAGA
jgi:hypothetical protein